jgi:hypothetical protein
MRKTEFLPDRDITPTVDVQENYNSLFRQLIETLRAKCWVFLSVNPVACKVLRSKW